MFLWLGVINGLGDRAAVGVYRFLAVLRRNGHAHVPPYALGGDCGVVFLGAWLSGGVAAPGSGVVSTLHSTN